MILPAAVDYAENVLALSCGRLKSMSGPMATMPWRVDLPWRVEEDSGLSKPWCLVEVLQIYLEVRIFHNTLLVTLLIVMTICTYEQLHKCVTDSLEVLDVDNDR